MDLIILIILVTIILLPFLLFLGGIAVVLVPRYLYNSLVLSYLS